MRPVSPLLSAAARPDLVPLVTMTCGLAVRWLSLCSAEAVVIHKELPAGQVK
jgi:hypothetical protein